MIRTIIKEPSSILRKKSQKVTKFNDNLLQLIRDMFDTMYAYGGIGLAAIQVSVPERVIVVDIGKEKWYFVNPEISDKSDEEVKLLEGCLSIPDKTAELKRVKSITLGYQDINGDFLNMQFQGYECRAILHEMDHLEGILFTDLIESTKLLDK